MALLNTVASVLSNALGAVGQIELQKPGAIPWEALIVSVFNFVVVYGWRIILFTVLLKLLLSPIDFISRYKMRKNSQIMEGLKDKLEAVDRQFSDPLERMRAKSAIQKQAGVNNLMACLPMLVPIIIFIWMSISMGNVARYMNMQNYVEWYNVYQSAYDAAGGNDEGGDTIVAKEIAQKAVEKYYKENGNDSFFVGQKYMDCGCAMASPKRILENQSATMRTRLQIGL